MKRKRLALLLAAALTVTSVDGTAFAVSGADFSSEPVLDEAEAQPEEATAEPAEENVEEESFADEASLTDETAEAETETESAEESQELAQPEEELTQEPVETVEPAEAEAEEEKGNFVTRLADGGYRRIVAAPKPQRIVELETIRALLNADQVVIAAGGGGIPVLEQGINLHGASAIIEKDLAAGLLAEELNADTLLILTSVENVSLNHGQVNEQKLGSITVADAKKYIEENQFASGSMLPKIEAGISFIEKGEGRSTVITDMAHAKEGYEGKTGTTIR